MITLRIFMMGLIALVPTQNGRNQSLTILLKDEFRAGACMKHVPVLVYEDGARDCQNQKDCTPEGDGSRIKREIDVKNKVYGFLLDQERITILEMGNNSVNIEPALDLRMLHQVLGDRPLSPEEAHDLIWIPRMKNIFPDASEVLERFVEESETSLRDLAAKLVVTDGMLTSYSLADVDNEVRSLTFRPLGSNVEFWAAKQAVTDIALLEMKLPGDRVQIELKKVDGSTRTLILKPLDEKKGVIDVLLGNITPLESVDLNAPAEHFAVYSGLTEYPSLASEMPIPHLGWASIGKLSVESADLPSVIKSVSVPEYPETPLLGKRRGGEAGSNRPICTLVIMEAPQTTLAQAAPTQEGATQGTESVENKPVPITRLEEAYQLVLQKFLPLDDVVAVEKRCDKRDDELQLFIGIKEGKEDDATARKIVEGVERFGIKANFFSPQYRTEACATRITQCNPLQPGISVGVSINDGRKTEGTLGMFVKQGSDFFLIGSAHVMSGKKEAEVFQPSLVHGVNRVIGEVTKRKLNKVDAALVSVRVGPPLLEQFKSEVKIKNLKAAVCGMVVEKSGLGTGVSKGRIAGLGKYEVEIGPHHTTIDVQGFRIVPIDPRNPQNEEISAERDSGAIWYLAGGDKNNGIGLGLHVAGETDDAPEKEEAIAADLNLVFSELGLSASDIP